VRPAGTAAPTAVAINARSAEPPLRATPQVATKPGRDASEGPRTGVGLGPWASGLGPRASEYETP
jgi:hypothetical protein